MTWNRAKSYINIDGVLCTIVFLFLVCILSDLIEHQVWKEFSSIQIRTVRGNVRTISNCKMRYSEKEMVIIKTKEEIFHMPRINIVYAIEAK